MKRMLVSMAVVLLLTSLTAVAQTRSFTKNDLEFVMELPSPTWQPVSRFDVHEHVDFSYGADPANGYLHLRKKLVAARATPADLFRQDEKWELQSLPGYVSCSACTGEIFEGNLKGATFAYEYASGGRLMSGRIYYLQSDNRTFYALHFTADREKLGSLRNDMDAIARSFRLK